MQLVIGDLAIDDHVIIGFVFLANSIISDNGV